MTGLVVGDSGVEFLDGDERVGPRRVLTPADETLLSDLGTRYVQAVQARAADDVFVALGRELWSWLEGDQGQLTALLDRVAPPFVFEVRGPKTPSDPEWAVLRAPFELLAPPAGGFLAADTLLRFSVVRRLGAPAARPPLDEFRLGLAFMASSPRRVDELDFEAEEAAILTAVDDTRVDLVVEDTGSPVELGRRLADLDGMPVVHLSCHGINRWRARPGGPAMPALMLEDEVGDELPTTAGDLVRLITRMPRLLFVSACLTATPAETAGHLPGGAGRRGRASGDGTEIVLAHSMATSLVSAGVPAVLGWDGSVYDRAATTFAEELYAQVSNRADVAVAVGDARRGLLNSTEPIVRSDWHLARLWVGPSGGGPIVGGRKRRSWASAVRGTKVLLDRKRKHVPVAAPDMFVGRRPELQRALRALRSPDHAGVLLQGQGRLGKSSLAARIADRCPHLTPAVVFGDYSATGILEVIEDAVRTEVAARDLIKQRRAEVRDRPDALEALLTDLFHGPCAEAGILLIIDDLEQVLRPNPDGPHRVDPQVAAVLAGVLRSVDPAATDSRLLLTSRFDFTLDGLQDRLEHIPLRPLSPVAQRKLLNRQQARVTPERRAERAELAERAVTVSRGNPGLQDLIGQQLVYNDQVETDRAERAVAEMESYLRQGDLPSEAKVREFLENLALDTLLAEAGPAHRALLRDLTLFDVPVPESVVEVLAQQSGGSPGRLVGLGLADVFPDSFDPRQRALAANALAAGRLEPLGAEETADLAGVVVEPLFAAWGGGNGDDRDPTLDLQLTRLAICADNPNVAASTAADAVSAMRDGRAADALKLGEDAITLLDRGQHPTPVGLLRRVAAAAVISGEGAAAERLFTRASQAAREASRTKGNQLMAARVSGEYAVYLIQRGDFEQAEELLRQAQQAFTEAGSEPEAVACQGSLADILYRRGLYDEALRIRREVELPVYEKLGDARAAAVTWGHIAAVLYQRGNYDEALRIRREVELPVYEKLGDARAAAVTWGHIAAVLYQRGNYDEALRIRREIQLPVYEKLGDARAAAVTWGKIADILYRRGDHDEALRIRREIQLPVYKKLGDVRSVAVAWGKIADILRQRGDHDEALRIHREVQLPAYEKLGDAYEIAMTWGRVAHILLLRGDHDEAKSLQEKRLQVHARLGDVAGLASAKWDLAQLALAEGETDAAYALTAEAFALLQQLKHPDGIAAVGSALGQFLVAAGDLEGAAAVLEISLAAAQKIGAAPLVSHIEQLITQATQPG